ncbi:hypothetical protein CPB84DRAFT_1827659 [Gymnopilus junonius]|uniref:N-acetyltransferase domain-containing protein n=1 Tax=Gymnopilus junonius TaxID=109634 RepID=A0A9P5NDA9_GYMJU|nr:hypothetical protein CPB84DRAFT_1827659 [Gymnopilus junonius]
MSSPFFAVFTHLFSYKTIRLKGLFTNPEAFGSTYARESEFSAETWHSHLNTPGRTTLGAAKGGDEVEGEWIGTLSIFSPEMLAANPENRLSYPPNLREAEDEGVSAVYMLVGMWVHSDYRRLGVGRALMDFALDAIKSFKSSQTEPGNTGGNEARSKAKFALLEVHTANTAARKLYENAGFTIQDGSGASDESEGGEMWMAMRLD